MIAQDNRKLDQDKNLAPGKANCPHAQEAAPPEGSLSIRAVQRRKGFQLSLWYTHHNFINNSIQAEGMHAQ